MTPNKFKNAKCDMSHHTINWQSQSYWGFHVDHDSRQNFLAVYSNLQIPLPLPQASTSSTMHVVQVTNHEMSLILLLTRLSVAQLISRIGQSKLPHQSTGSEKLFFVHKVCPVHELGIGTTHSTNWAMILPSSRNGQFHRLGVTNIDMPSQPLTWSITWRVENVINLVWR